MPRSRLRGDLVVPAEAFPLIHGSRWIGQETPVSCISVLEGRHGHDGCVNALSWIDNHTLASSGDDTRVHFWRLDSSGTDYSFNCVGAIHTGHTANIFGVRLLPSSASTVVTCARDGQVRVFDATRARSIGSEPGYPSSSTGTRGSPLYLTAQEAGAKVFRCHNSDVKRICTADGSPYTFMTVSEDGTVRHFDLRQPHTCTRRCNNTLIDVSFPLNALTSSTLRPNYLAVAGESPYGYLFDRRSMRGSARDEWGGSHTDNEELTTCVRRYGRERRAAGEGRGEEHITGARLSNENSEELLLSYHADAVYLYGLHDEPFDRDRANSTRQHRRKRRRVSVNSSDDEESESPDDLDDDANSPNSGDAEMDIDGTPEDDSDDETEETQPAADVFNDDDLDDSLRNAAVVRPRTRFAGAANIRTIKDVNFLGQHDEYVVSGSDDGNWFMWDKTGALQGVWEGDGSVVINVIEPHRHLPIVATSGIDDTVKIFSPAPTRRFSRMDRAPEIVAGNAERRPRMGSYMITPMQLLRLRAHLLQAGGNADDDDDESECVQQ